MRTSQDKLSSYTLLKERMKKMVTAIADLSNIYRRINSEITTFETKKIVASANIGSKDYYIHQGSEINVSNPQITVRVMQPFVIEVTPSEEEYLATSRISNAYQLGATQAQAVRNYCELLVDELIWLQKHEQNLSVSIQQDLHLLQCYLQVV